MYASRHLNRNQKPRPVLSPVTRYGLSAMVLASLGAAIRGHGSALDFDSASSI